MSEKLTPEQLANWREIFPKVFGHSAEGLTDDEIQEARDRLEEATNAALAEEEGKAAAEPATCPGCIHKPHADACSMRSFIITNGSRECMCASRTES